MVYTLSRQAFLAVKAEKPEDRAEARKALGGLLAIDAAGAGVLGLPLVSTLLAAASAVGGSDDEPWDAEVALRNMLADALGQKPAEVLARGLSRLTPSDISGRVGLDNLILPDLQEGLEGQRLGESAMAAALGPVAGIGVALKGLQEIAAGNWARGLEAMAPSVLRGPLKSVRYAVEGVVGKTGKAVLADVDGRGILGQALGFSPSDVRLAYEGKSAIYKADQRLVRRRAALMRQFSMTEVQGVYCRGPGAKRFRRGGSHKTNRAAQVRTHCCGHGTKKMVYQAALPGVADMPMRHTGYSSATTRTEGSAPGRWKRP